jgi:sporulation protein YlmC with PRC-barrel domain
MNPDGRIKLVSQLLDLPLLDSDGKYCGIVDDVEFTGGPGKELKIKALLVGPGAYDRRLPDWATWLVRKLAGDRIARVPFDRVRTIAAVVELDCPGSELRLLKSERRAEGWIPHKGAL